jgi:hypothetical protein
MTNGPADLVGALQDVVHTDPGFKWGEPESSQVPQVTTDPSGYWLPTTGQTYVQWELAPEPVSPDAQCEHQPESTLICRKCGAVDI